MARAIFQPAAYCHTPFESISVWSCLMARRKRQFLEDDDSDSSPASEADEPNFDDHNDPDARAERRLFEDPYHRKRTRKNAKEDAIYGVFGSDEDEEMDDRRTKQRTKAPAFVSSSTKVTLDEDVNMDGSANSPDEDEDLVGNNDASDASGSESSKAPSPRAHDMEDEEEKPRFGGLGLGARKGGIGSSKGGIGSVPAFSKGGIGSSITSAFAKGGIGSTGFTKGGIGSSQPAEPASVPSSSASPSPAPVATESFPTAFGGARGQRSFRRNADTGPDKSRSATPLSTAEHAHFSKISGSFGSRMLEKMGWAAGQGLGTEGAGIVTPVESKLRPKGMGLAFKGFKEKTEQSKAEARRRGEIVSDDDEESKGAARKARKAARAQEERKDVWKKPKKTKTRVEHKTYEEILAEAGPETSQAGIGPIIDATGATVSVPAFQMIHFS